MIYFSWDSGYEASPTNALNRALIDDEIRKMAMGLRGVMEEDHFFGASGGPNGDLKPETADNYGYHRGGWVQLALIGSTNMPTSNVSTGALFISNAVTDDIQLQMWSASTWTTIATKNHASLTARTTGNPHTNYLLATGGATTSPLDMGGEALIATTHSSWTNGGFLLYGHRGVAHTATAAARTTPSVDWDVMEAAALTSDKFAIVQATTTVSVGPNSQTTVSYGAKKLFFPHVEALAATSLNITWTFGATVDGSQFDNSCIFLFNGTAATVQFRVSWEYIL